MVTPILYNTCLHLSQCWHKWKEDKSMAKHDLHSTIGCFFLTSKSPLWSPKRSRMDQGQDWVLYPKWDDSDDLDDSLLEVLGFWRAFDSMIWSQESRTPTARQFSWWSFGSFMSPSRSAFPVTVSWGRALEPLNAMVRLNLVELVSGIFFSNKNNSGNWLLVFQSSKYIYQWYVW